jgi:hypothetical protein
MPFMLRKGWSCQFLEPELQTALPLLLSFADVEKVRELARRGGGLPDLESASALEHGIEIGRGGVWLNLTQEQYVKFENEGMTTHALCVTAATNARRKRRHRQKTGKSGAREQSDHHDLRSL